EEEKETEINIDEVLEDDEVNSVVKSMLKINKSKDKIKRAGAIAGIVIILGIFLITVIAAIFAKDNPEFFIGMFYIMFGLPIVIYGYSLIIKFFNNSKH
ncbi:MAG: hypothetical protein K6G26_13130, partial [Lachnospiraceae bacterium]|nr:hypothetical protein [Lachnospiraceae bacterium]